MSNNVKKDRLPSALAVLKKARAQVKKGWTKGSWDSDGKVCVQGALAKGYGAAVGASTVRVGTFKDGYLQGQDYEVDVDYTPAGRALLEALTKEQLVRVNCDEFAGEAELKRLRRTSITKLREDVELPSWNDEKKTNKAEVLATFDRAIKRLEKKRQYDANRKR